LPAFVIQEGLDAPPSLDNKTAAIQPRFFGGGERAQLFYERIGGGGYFSHLLFLFIPEVNTKQKQATDER